MAASEPEIVKGTAQFTKTAYQVLAKKGGNVIFSPLSIHAALSIVYQGASDSLVEQFKKVLGVSEASAAAEGHQSIIDFITSISDISLSIGDKVFVDSSKSIKPEIKSIVDEKFKGGIESVDFKETGKAADTINNWVKEKTKEKTTALYKPEDLHGAVSAVVSTLYFRGSFTDAFEASNTKKLPFYYNGDNKVDVQMMERTGSYFYKDCDTLSSSLIELKYNNEDFSLVIILPIKRDGLAHLETKIQRCNLSEITEDAKVRPVCVHLPKFKFDKTVEFKDTLKEMGLDGIFSKSENFNGIADNFEVSKVTQKVVLSVDEKGSEGTDASGGSFDFGGGANPRSPVVRFTADHPFLFLLTHERCEGTREILLYGKVEKPEF